MIAAMRYAVGEPVEEAVGPEPAQPQLSQWELPSWEEIVRAHSARVFRLAYRLTGNQHDAEDLTQEVFVRVFRSLSSYTPGTFEGWLHRITTNLFLDGARRRQRIRFEGLGDDVAQRLPGSDLTPAQVWDERHFDGDIQEALTCPPPGLPCRGRALRHRRLLLRGDRGHHGREARHGAQPYSPRASAAAGRARAPGTRHAIAGPARQAGG